MAGPERKYDEAEQLFVAKPRIMWDLGAGQFTPHVQELRAAGSSWLLLATVRWHLPGSHAGLLLGQHFKDPARAYAVVERARGRDTPADP